MKASYFVLFVIAMVVFISGCATQQPQRSQQKQNTICKPDYIFGGTMQKVGNMETKFNASCSSLCENKYKIKSYRVDKKSDIFYICYCDINECKS